MTPILSPQDFFNPQLSSGAQIFIRVAYGLLLFCTLVITLPHWKRFFISERWGGYAKSSPDVDILQNPVASVLIGAVWFLCAGMLISGSYTVWAALANLIICRYFFIHMRWKGVLRGSGAPGFISYWMAWVVFLLEATYQFAPDLRSLAILVLQVDFAFIMLSAGIYKFTAGYAKNEGMEYGMVNPEWGYWWKLFKQMPPGHWLFKSLNFLAWFLEVMAGVFMLVPPLRFIGGAIILVSFVFIATQIRLGLLCEMVIVGCVLFFHPGSFGDQCINYLLGSIASTQPEAALFKSAYQVMVHQVLFVGLWGYLILLPLAHCGLFYNYYARKTLPPVLQTVLEKYTNFFGMIIWRVFSVDIVNFFVLIHLRSRDNSQRTLISRYGWEGGLRFNHVAESITVTSLFTTLKYYASNPGLFNERLLRYARTLDCPPECVLEFEYMSIRKSNSAFEFVPVAQYMVDTVDSTVTERILDKSASVHAAHSVSPVQEGVKPGSYVPLKR